MTAPDPDDPLVCINTRMAGGQPTCRRPEAHCDRCQMCDIACDCPKTASPWTKGDRVRVTYDAVYYSEPSIKPDQYALVVLPGTDLNSNPLILDRFRAPITALSRQDGNDHQLDKTWLAAALEAFAQHGMGADSWNALCDVISHHTADHHRANVTAAIAPLQAEIRRLTAEVENLKRSKENDRGA